MDGWYLCVSWGLWGYCIDNFTEPVLDVFSLGWCSHCVSKYHCAGFWFADCPHLKAIPPALGRGALPWECFSLQALPRLRLCTGQGREQSVCCCWGCSLQPTCTLDRSWTILWLQPSPCTATGKHSRAERTGRMEPPNLTSSWSSVKHLEKVLGLQVLWQLWSLTRVVVLWSSFLTLFSQSEKESVKTLWYLNLGSTSLPVDVQNPGCF